MVEYNHYIQVSPGESIAHHPLATILIQNLFHVLDEVVQLSLELVLVFLGSIWLKHEVD